MADTPTKPVPTRLVLKLRSPVTIGDITVDKITLTEPTGAQLAEAGDFGGMRQLLKLIELNGKVLEDVAAGMRQRDLNEAADFFARFNESSGPTGQDGGAES